MASSGKGPSKRSSPANAFSIRAFMADRRPGAEHRHQRRGGIRTHGRLATSSVFKTDSGKAENADETMSCGEIPGPLAQGLAQADPKVFADLAVVVCAWPALPDE